ncbi:MAG: hypothetical protein HQK52_20115 [Oligoflexia bacterium]|nr:hypothetical protein [Oligoflexia bacterium]
MTNTIKQLSLYTILVFICCHVSQSIGQGAANATQIIEDNHSVFTVSSSVLKEDKSKTISEIVNSFNKNYLSKENQQEIQNNFSQYLHQREVVSLLDHTFPHAPSGRAPPKNGRKLFLVK